MSFRVPSFLLHLVLLFLLHLDIEKLEPHLHLMKVNFLSTTSDISTSTIINIIWNKSWTKSTFTKKKLYKKSSLLWVVDSETPAFPQNGIFSMNWLFTSETWEVILIIAVLMIADKSLGSTHLSSMSLNTKHGTIGKLHRRLTIKNGKRSRVY